MALLTVLRIQKLQEDVCSDDDSATETRSEDNIFLNDLTIFEYFENYNQIPEDEQMDEKDDGYADNLIDIHGPCIDLLDKEAVEMKQKKTNSRKLNKQRKRPCLCSEGWNHR